MVGHRVVSKRWYSLNDPERGFYAGRKGIFGGSLCPTAHVTRPNGARCAAGIVVGDIVREGKATKTEKDVVQYDKLSSHCIGRFDFTIPPLTHLLTEV